MPNLLRRSAPVVPAPTLEQCIRHLAGHDLDRATAVNGVGFNKLDGERGHRLAKTPEAKWSYRDSAWAWRKVRFYRKQLDAAGLRWDLIPEPVVPPEPEPEKWIRLHEGGGFFTVQYAHLHDEEYRKVFNAVRMLPGRQFIFEEKLWLLPFDSVSARALQGFAIEHDFDLGPGVEDKFFQLIEKAAIVKQLARGKHPVGDYEIPPEVLAKFHFDDTFKGFFPHQVAGVQLLELCGWTGICGDDMGSGKTMLAALAAVKAGVFEKDRADDRHPRLLFIVPSGAKATIANAMRTRLPWAKVVVVQGTAMQDINADIVICNPDIFRHDAEGEPAPIVKLFMMVRWAGLVVDEAHYFKGWTTMRTIVLRKLLEAQDIPFRLCMSGTILVNRIPEFVVSLEVAKLLDHFGGQGRFLARYAYGGSARDLHEKLLEIGYFVRMVDPHVFTPDGSQLLELEDVPTYHLPVDMLDRYDKAEIRAHLESRGYRWEDGVLDLPKGSRFPLTAELTAAGLAEVKRFQTDFEGWLKDTIAESGDDVEAWSRAQRAMALVMINKGRQLNGKVKAPALIAWLRETLEAGKKVIAYCIHDTMYDQLIEAFPGCAKITGGDGALRQKNIDYFINDISCRLLVAKMKAGGEGIDGLQKVCNTMVFAELGWNPAAHSQPEKRIRRSGQSQRVSWYYATTPGTIDAYMADVINKKRPIVNGAAYGLDVPHDSTVSAVLNAYIADMQKGAIRDEVDLGSAEEEEAA